MDQSITSEDFNNTSLSPLLRFGFDVKRVRLGRKFTQKHLGSSTGYSESYVCQVESGKLMPSEKFATGCDKTFGTDGLFEDLLHRIEDGDHPVQFVPYVQLEEKATSILDFSTVLIKGLLQTPQYAEAIFRAGHPNAPDELIQSKVAARLSRQNIFNQDRPPSLWVVLHEAGLRTCVGGTFLMARQIDHLLEIGHRPGIDIQVLPTTKGAAAVHAGPFTLLTFADQPTVLYTDDPQGGRLCRRTATVKNSMQHYDRIRAHALPPDESLAFIESVRQEYTL